MSLYLDFETKSTKNIKQVSAYAYVDDPAFDILMCAWNDETGPTRLAIGREEILAIPGLLDPDVLKVAHNANFERVCLSAYLGMPVGEYLPPEQFDDTQARATEWGYPMALEALAKALGVTEKDSAGTLLINWFCKPQRDGTFRRPEDHPEKWKRFCDYCVQDVDTMMEIDMMLRDWPTEQEQRNFWADQRINDRGVRIDLGLARAAVAATEENLVAYDIELCTILGVTNSASNQQMLPAMRRLGFPIKDLQKETIEQQAARDDLTDVQRRALELRQELALTASSKFAAALRGVNSDGRLRGQFKFFGAHTGRWSGKGVQLHNLPRLGFTDDEGEHDDAAQTMAIWELKEGMGADADILKRLVRPLLLGPFTVVDYSAIEARVIAWLAGEEWALDAFRHGRDIYVETANRMPGGPYTRSQGKVAVLALGYQGAIESLRHMGAEGTDEELLAIVQAWRKANAMIVRFWKAMQAAFIDGGQAGEHIFIEKDGADRYMWLPSGRALVYHDLRWITRKTPRGPEKAIAFKDYRYNGVPQATYGGRLSENATQAVARDLLAHAMTTMVERGQPVVAHVHDEAVVEFVSTGKFEGHSLAAVKGTMTAKPAWAEGLPVDAAGFTCDRYRKG